MRKKVDFHALIEYLSRVQHVSDAVPRNYGIGFPLKTTDIHLLDLIDKHPGDNLTRLAERALLSKMAISKGVRRLEGKGLLTISAGSYSKELYCELTEIGKLAVDTHDAYHRAENVYLSQQLSQYTSEELALVERFLFDYGRYLEEYSRNASIL